MSGDYSQDPEFKAWEARVHADLIPKLASSGSVISMVPKGETDIKFAVELGLSIMMNKPILALVQPGTDVPPKLNLVADKVIVADLSTALGNAKAQTEIKAFLETLPED